MSNVERGDEIRIEVGKYVYGGRYVKNNGEPVYCHEVNFPTVNYRGRIILNTICLSETELQKGLIR